MAKEDSVKWPEVEEILQKAEKKELISLIREMYTSSAGDRMLINSRYLGERVKKKKSKLLEEHRKIIRGEFPPENESGKIRHAAAERAISDYSNASGDFVGTLDLMLTYVEGGIRYANIFGAADDEFYDNIEGMLERFCELLKTKEGQKYYPHFRERLANACRDSEHIGWGFEEVICVLVGDIEEFFEGEQKDTAE
ncbi:hypothetical protein ACSAZK_17265 [Methanosarcina sp. Mfa9]|uniref:hypothetical protein n=1 Tax=Methanosarcina sp. Mfa9 TaxID=3439063 RepID=UPI003F85C70B